MPKIREMSPHLADLIAAGEVVERPASVVKELCENSIDAGAKSVTVEIKNGGMTEIRVTDDGCGMSPEDVETAFLRHATSKIYTERDLEAIATLGFRGEALAAIASVSRVELLTREPASSEGTRLLLEAGVKTDKAPVGAPVGTTIYVRDLFFNTPARQKFMKNDRAESSAVGVAVVRLALSHPEVSIRYLRDGREEYHTPGDGRLQSAAYCTLGREFAMGLLEVSNKTDSMEATGYTSTPGAARGNRSWQFFFVNGRAVKSKLLQAAVEQAYKNSLFTGRFPVCVINLKMNLSAVDVNVHPTKMEVRFSDERAAFDTVYWAVRGALEREDGPGELKISQGTLKVTGTAPRPESDQKSAAVKPRGDFFKSVSAEDYRSGKAGPKAPGERVEFRDVVKSGYQTKLDLPAPSKVRAPEAYPRYPAPKLGSGTDEDEAPAVSGTRATGETPRTDDTPAREPEEEREWRLVGEALNTYIIVERGDSIFLIDKHAAHERMLFDKLKAQKREPSAQILLTPVVCALSGEDERTILENSELLEKLGFEIDEFGPNTLALRQVPMDMDLSDPRGTLEEIAGKLRLGGKRDVEAMGDDILHTVACKAAIKAGRRSEPGELSELIEKVLSGAVRYCPHGRPVSMELTKYQLDRSFKRA